MKKAGLGNLPSTHYKKLWAPIAFLMSTIYFGGLLANWNRNKDIRMEGELFAPSITIAKTGVARSLSGGPGCDRIEYTITVTNTSTNGEVLSGVDVDVPLPNILPITGPDMNEDVNNDGVMDPNESWTYTVYYTVLEDDINNGEIVSQATVTADVQGQPGVDVFDSTQSVLDLTACQGAVSVVKTGNLAIDGFGQPNCNLALYTFQVKNESPSVTLENVALSDPLISENNLPGPNSEDININGILEPGETWTYSAQYNITETDIDNGLVENQVTVTANVQGLLSVIATDQAESVIDLSGCQPGIYAIKTGQALDFSGAPGCDVIRYTIEVVNSSFAIPLDNVTLSDPLISDLDLPGPDSENLNANGILEPGETWTYIAQYTIEADDIANGFVENRAMVTATVQGQPNIVVTDESDDDSPTGNDYTVVDLSACQPGVYAIKTGQAVSISGGPGCDLIQYTIEVVNSSWIYSLDTVILTDPLFGEDPIVGPDMNEDVGNDGVLDPGESWTYTLQHDITDMDIVNGQVINQAEVVANVQGQPGETVSDLSDNDSPTEDQTTVVDLSACQGNISLIKSLVVNSCNEIEYLLGIINNSIYGQELENIVVNDPLLGGDISGPLPGQDIGDDGILSVGEIWLYTAVYDVQQTDIENGQIINQATVTSTVRGMPDVIVSDLSDDDSPLEDDPTVTSLVQCQNPALGLIKEGVVIDINGDGCSESIVYTFTLKNTAGVDLDEVILEDALLGGQVIGPKIGSDMNNDGVLSFGETWTFEALYAITQNDIDNGSILNQATVTANTVANNIPVFDLSDNNDFFEDEMTATSVPNDACTDGGTSLGLIKQGVLVDTNFDGCLDTVRYTFTITSSGGVAFDNIVLMDQLLGGQITGPVVGSDQNSDGILSPGETWTYEADYFLVQGDIDTGNVMNQAIVAGEPVGFDFQLMDLSDNDSYTENEATETIVPSDACTDGGTPIGFEIFNGITPNGDGSNDYFRVLGIENYPDNQLKIYNRWGVLVYESENYGQGNNLFYGISEGRATFQKDKELPSGTYFYILTFSGPNPGKDSYSGYLYINRD